jgi:hypothetical protein
MGGFFFDLQFTIYDLQLEDPREDEGRDLSSEAIRLVNLGKAWGSRKAEAITSR